MSEEHVVVTQQETRPRGMPGLTWAIILIAIGVVFLLNNLHIAGFSINWFQLARFWPVILILVGLDVLIGRRSVLGSLAVAAISLSVIAGLIWFVGFNSVAGGSLGRTITRDVTQELGDATSASLVLDLGAANTTIETGKGLDALVEGRYSTNENLGLDTNYEIKGGVGTLTIKQENPGQNTDVFNDFVGDLNLSLTDSVPLEIIVNAGVGQVKLDLAGADLTSLLIKGGIGNMEITLPEEGEYTVVVDVGIGQVTLFTPRALEARVDFDGGISNADVPSRYESRGDSSWETSGYDGASDHATINIKAGIGNFEIVDR